MDPVAIICVAICTLSPQPVLGRSNEALVAAMPDDVESVLLFRPNAFQPEAEPLARTREWLRVAFLRPPEDKEDLLLRALRAASSAGVEAVAWAGSDFAAPPGFGIGEFEQRLILLTARPMEALRASLSWPESLPGFVGTFEAEGLRVYQARSGAPKPDAEDIYLAMPDARTLVIAENRGDVEEMIRGLAVPRELPERWRGIIHGDELQSPFLILREYDEDNLADRESPRNPEREGGPVDVTGIALVLPGGDQNVFRLRVTAPDSVAALNYFKSEALPHDYFHWEHDLHEGEFDATLRPRDDAPPGEAETWFLPLFGPNLAL